MRLKFVVGDYNDTVICDVRPMDACHLLLGRPWQYDRRSTHDGRSITYSCWDNGRRHVLRPMFDKEILVDAKILQKKNTVEKVTQNRGRFGVKEEGMMWPSLLHI